MNISKRGDHLFAAGLLKTIRDVTEMVFRSEIGGTSEGRVLQRDILAMQRLLGGSEFEMTVNRGRVVTAPDPHSIAFGAAARDFTLTMRSLVFSLEHRRGIGSEGRQSERNEQMMQAARLVTDAKRYARVAVNRVFDAVIDPGVLQQLAQGSDRTRTTQIATARANLQRVRADMLASIGKM
ncbi:MAG: hypothetical protein V4801_37450 [Burkholderia gladioli]